MKNLIIVLSLIGLLSACSTSPEYRAATNNGYGYQESILNQDKVRVQFKTRSYNKLKAIDYTFLRAGEITVKQNYDWFIVTHRNVIVNGKNPPSASMHTGFGTRRECGLLGCTNHPSSEVGVGINLSEQGQDIESILEIKLGKGIRPETQESYEAREIINNMRTKYQLNDQNITTG